LENALDDAGRSRGFREWSELEGAPPVGGEARGARFSILEGAHMLAFVPLRLRKTPRLPSPWSSNEPRTPPGTQRARSHALARTHARTHARRTGIRKFISLCACFDCRVTCDFDFSSFMDLYDSLQGEKEAYLERETYQKSSRVFFL